MRRASRRGFTPAEFLVVVAILLTAVGLLTPAVVNVREAAARTQCGNNLKILAIAVHNVHDSHGFIPSNPDTLNDRPGTLQDHLQPYLE